MNNQLSIPFDVCARYHGGNAESVEANKRVDKQQCITRILAFMASKADRSTYVKEIIRELNMKHQTASARLTELKADGVVIPLVKDGQRVKREHCGVVVLAQ